jgi:hypothetical protein
LSCPVWIPANLASHLKRFCLQEGCKVNASLGVPHYIIDVEELADAANYSGKRCDYSVLAQRFTILVEIKCGSISASVLEKAEEQLRCGKDFLNRYRTAPTKGRIVAGKKIDPIVNQYLLMHPKKNLTVMQTGLKHVTIQGIQFDLQFC